MSTGQGGFTGATVNTTAYEHYWAHDAFQKLAADAGCERTYPPGPMERCACGRWEGDERVEPLAWFGHEWRVGVMAAFGDPEAARFASKLAEEPGSELTLSELRILVLGILA